MKITAAASVADVCLGFAAQDHACHYAALSPCNPIILALLSITFVPVAMLSNWFVKKGHSCGTTAVPWGAAEMPYHFIAIIVVMDGKTLTFLAV